jgi:hypothetical protein
MTIFTWLMTSSSEFSPLTKKFSLSNSAASSAKDGFISLARNKPARSGGKSHFVKAAQIMVNELPLEKWSFDVFDFLRQLLAEPQHPESDYD